MNASQQMQLILQTIEDAKTKGKAMSIAQAQRKLHREYIQNQLYNRYGVSMQGFLVLAGLTHGKENGRLRHDPKIYNVFNRFLNMENSLTGDSGIILRDAMERLGVEYLNSPTYPLEPLNQLKGA